MNYLNDSAPAAWCELYTADLARLLRAMLPAAAGTKEVRHYLRGVAIDCRSDGLRLVATDGKRMHWAKSLPTAQGGPEVVGEGLQVLHRDDVARLLKRWGAKPSGRVRVELRPCARVPAGTHASGKPETVARPGTLRVDGEEFLCAAGDCRYPDYTRMLPRALLGTETTALAVGLNLQYLAEAAEAMGRLSMRHGVLRAGDGNQSTHLTLDQDALDTRMSGWLEAGAVIMPVRL